MNCNGYTPLHAGILASTIWQEDDKTRLVWITMLALKDKNHFVSGSIPGLAHIARVAVEDCRNALNKLQSSDPDSRTKDFEGKRIEPVDGGWMILNGPKFTPDRNPNARREYMREYIQEYRQSGKDKSRPVNSGKQLVNQGKPRLAQAEAEAEAEAKTKRESLQAAPAPSLPVEIDYWNSSCGNLPKVKAWTEKRNRILKQRRLDPFWLSNYREAILKMAGSEFCNGKTDRGWIASIDFLLQPDSVAKAMEGKYDNRNGHSKPQTQPDHSKGF